MAETVAALPTTCVRLVRVTATATMTVRVPSPVELTTAMALGLTAQTIAAKEILPQLQHQLQLQQPLQLPMSQNATVETAAATRPCAIWVRATAMMMINVGAISSVELTTVLEAPLIQLMTAARSLNVKMDIRWALVILVQ
jgi:hypothetical protein